MRQPRQRILAQGLDLKDQVISDQPSNQGVKAEESVVRALVVVGDESGHVALHW